MRLTFYIKNIRICRNGKSNLLDHTILKERLEYLYDKLQTKINSGSLKGEVFKPLFLGHGKKIAIYINTNISNNPFFLEIVNPGQQIFPYLQFEDILALEDDDFYNYAETHIRCFEKNAEVSNMVSEITFEHLRDIASSYSTIVVREDGEIIF